MDLCKESGRIYVPLRSIDEKQTRTMEEIVPGDFYFEKAYEICGFGALVKQITHNIVTSSRANFELTITKVSEKKIKFDVNLLNCINLYSCTIMIEIFNNNPKIKTTKTVRYNFSPEFQSTEIIISSFSKKKKYIFDEPFGFLTNDVMKINIILSHEEQLVFKSKRKAKNIVFEEEAYIIPEEIGIKSIPRIRRRTNDDTYSVLAEQYCGILNQGSTCYMNSILQAFYHLPALRRLLFQLELDPNSDKQSNMIWNLRQLYATMSEQTDPVSTRELTQSFGWIGEETVNHQQDIIELYIMIIDMLTTKLEGTPFENEILSLFIGEQRSYRRCINVPFNKVSVEKFSNITLTVQGCRNLNESLMKYIEPEYFGGVNQYKTDEYGYQDGEMGCEFLKFPSVLYFHLKRIEYDCSKFRMFRVNSKYEFPLKIDMSNYLAKDAQNDGPLDYDLFGVIAHAGEAMNGHFYAYLRTDSQDDQWYLFNDSAVSFASQKSAVSDNFGGKKNPERQHYSAYILIYMKHNELSKLFCPVSIDMIRGAVPISNVFDDPQNFEDFLPIKLFTDTQIDPETFKFQKPATLDISSHSTLINLYKKVAKRMKMKDIRLWHCFNDKIFSPIDCSPDSEVDTSLSSLSFFVERYNGFRNEILIFLEFYSPLFEWPRIRFLRTISVPGYSKVINIFPFIDTIMDIEQGESFLVFVQSAPFELKEINAFMTFENLMINDGAFLVFQVVPQRPQPSSAPPYELASDQKITNYFDIFPEEAPKIADVYFALINMSMKLIISKPKGKSDVVLSIPGTFNFRNLRNAIIKLYKLNFDPTKEEVKLENEEKLDNNKNFEKEEMYFYKDESVMPVNVSEFPVINYVFQDDDKISFITTRKKDKIARIILTYAETSLQIYVPTIKYFSKNAKVSNLIAHSRKHFGIDESLPIRAIQIKAKKQTLERVLDDELLLLSLSNPIRVEIIPVDQREMKDNEFIVRCRKELKTETGSEAIPSPFFMKIIKDEIFEITKKRIRLNLDVNDVTWAHLTFHLDESESKTIADETVLSDLTSENSQIVITFPRKEPMKKGDSEGVKLYV